MIRSNNFSMKYLLIAILALATFSSKAQLNPSKHTPVTKPIAVSGKKPLDAHSMRYDESAFDYFEFASLAEANSYVPSNARGGHPFVFIKTGNVVDIYWWKNGTADSNLVRLQSNVDVSSLTTLVRLQDSLAAIRAYIDTRPTGTGGITSIVTNPKKITGNGITTPLDVREALMAEGAAALARWYGDSLTWGTGGTPTSQFPDGTPYMVYVQNATGFRFLNYGIPGQGIDSILARFYRDSANKAMRQYSTQGPMTEWAVGLHTLQSSKRL
jgi:hypothetical protein